MYNSNIPSRDELPSTKQLLRSTLIAIATAIVLLVTTVLPAEYNIDPTGAGRLLGLTEMGEIKEQLSREAEQDRLMDSQPAPAGDKRSGLIGKVLAELFLVKPASASVLVAQAKAEEYTLTLKPGEGAEVKLEMRKGAKVSFEWRAAGGGVNYDTHGDPYDAPRDFYHGYGKGRASPGEKGVLEAAFDGHHGWFWRNRTGKEVTVTLRVEGEFIALKRVV
ncbi:MAG: transmembrane anchor protein [Alphaproteobacteria bacterium]|nr:transmembrane anchor protein [Alphaproteobacteria bacterium]MBU0797634.1 transmembrane anchor protein [Alphaproteobacteria bacterium]MBU0887508.1 transmembrane anchor protein [Alphaproteobacteria bacterium]MBU1814745.1 transmembrane anchor protein [Alphaproteobacteria bacterium]MBU2091573.1 transmembrane anchor protein [Alphaproteobacteria bacterium]